MLHTAGLESDYAMLLRESTLLNFREEDPEVLLIEYQMRKISLIFYYGYGLLKADIGTKEETNELKRDIVGHDIYGAVRHLHRPDMDFHRYTNYDDLTGEEKSFVKRVGWRSLLNLIDPLLIGKTGFRIHKDYRLNFNLGYGMAPFGDYIDEHFWLSAHDGVKTHLYIRQFENKNTWFPAFGIDFSNIKIGQKVTLNASAHGWKQPEAMSFTQTSGKPGGAIDVMGKYRFFSSRKQGVKGISVNIGVLAKSKGFLLEEVNLGRHFGIRFGTSIWL